MGILPYFEMTCQYRNPSGIDEPFDRWKEESDVGRWAAGLVGLWDERRAQIIEVS
jgi:hypothetical protein